MNAVGEIRTVAMTCKFFTGYRQTCLDNSDVVLSIFIPKCKSNEYCLAYKQSKRRDDDIAIVNMAINVSLSPENDILGLRLAFGGIAPQVAIPLDKTFKSTLKKFDVTSLDAINGHLTKYLQANLKADAPGGPVSYRQTLVLSLFHKAFFEIEGLVNGKKAIIEKPLKLKSLQLFEEMPESQPKADLVGRPTMVVAAYKQSTGEAQFCDDIPKFENELAIALVLSTRAHAKILKIDAEEALKQEGVQGFFSAKDITPEMNTWGPILKDETVFAKDIVTSSGHIIGMIVANTRAQAQLAIKLVKIEYEDLPAILTLEEAIEQKSFFNEFSQKLEKGDVDKTFREAKHSIEKTFRTGKQEHFYMENHSCIVTPKVRDFFVLKFKITFTSKIGFR